MTTAELRDLRTAIDRAVRAKIDDKNLDRGDLCGGCGMPRYEWTPLCETCSQRHLRWRRGTHERPYVDNPGERVRVRAFTEKLVIDKLREGVAHANEVRWGSYELRV